MSPALGEPPDSGVKASEKAGPAVTSRPVTAARLAVVRTRRRLGNVCTWLKAGGSLPTGPAARPCPGAREFATCPSGAPELRGPFGEEGRDALREVAGGRHVLLQTRLEVELLGQAAVAPGVQLGLRAGVGARRP